MQPDSLSIPDNYQLSDPIPQEDGSDVYEIHDQNAIPMTETPQQNDFDINLADVMSDDALGKIAAFLDDRINEDLDSREEWLSSVNKVKGFLGFEIEDTKNVPFPNATRTFDTTLSTALIRFYATMRSEFFPDTGPAHVKISENGRGSNPQNQNPEQEEQIETLEGQIKDFLNSYLTTGDKDYYADCIRSLLYLGFYGNVVKKIFVEPSSGNVLSRFIVPEDFIVNNDCLSLLESERLTHVLHMSARDILSLEKKGYYKNYEKSTSDDNNNDSDDALKNKDLGINVSVYPQKTLKKIYECHTYLSLKSFVEGDSFAQSVEEKDLTLPYIVTFNPETKKILRITRNWEEQDASFKKINYFVNYQYLPGFGIYGLGLAQLLGTNAIALTKILRQLIDAGSFKNLPGGLRQKGLKQQQSDVMVGPGQFVEVDTGSRPLQDVFMPLPYSEPSQSLRELRQELIAQTRELAATAELKMNDQNPNAPVGTTLAMIEMNQKIQSATFKSFYFSLSEELTKIFELLKFSKGVFSSIPLMDVLPTADPALDSKMHRLIKAESLLKIAGQFPHLYDDKEVNTRYCQALGIDDIDKIWKAPEESPEIPALDPVTENTLAIKQQPIQAYIWQDHSAHIVVHSPLAEENLLLQSHIADHQAFDYLIQMQQKMGMEMPDPQALQENQELQNQIAYKAAQAVMNDSQQQKGNAVPVDPKAEALKEIAALEAQQKMIQLQVQYQQKMAEIASKEKIEQSKAETSVFKSQLDFEKEMNKIEAQKEIAEKKEPTYEKI